MLSTLSDRASTVSPLPLCTLDDARHLGINLRSGWARVRKGIYVNSDAYDKLSARDKYAVRVRAFIRMNPDAVLCLESAGVIHGVPQFGETKDIHVFDPHRTSSWRHSDVSVHTSKDPRTIERVNGVLVTSLVDTVCDAADQQNQRGRARMQLVWAHADPLSESPAESLSRAVIAWSGFEVPVLQREFIYEGQCDRVDFYFESVRAIGEADGWGKYDLMNNDDPMAKLKDEKRREDRLRRHRHPFARWEMRDIWSVKPLTAKLVEIGVPRVAPKHDALLITFRNNPRAKPWKKGG